MTSNFLDCYLQRRTTSGNVTETSSSTEVSLRDTEQTERDNTEYEAENTVAGCSKKEQPPASNRGGKRKRPTADDIDKEYLDSLKEIGRRMEETSSDCDRMFLLSLLPAMKQLSPLVNMDFRVEVQEFLCRKLRRSAAAEFQTACEGTSASPSASASV
jgi:hypothetical protein